VEVTCIDMAMPMILIDAQQMDKTGGESPAELEADLAFMQRLEKIRRKAGEAMGFGDVTDKDSQTCASEQTHGGRHN
jgi:2-methylaconitate cis-trans-isomerase PrpF